MTTYQDGRLAPEELAILADTITALRPDTISGRQYAAGYRNGISDAAARVLDVYRRASAAAYAAEVDGGDGDELAGVATDLLRLAVRLGMVDQAEIDRRAAILGGGVNG